MKKNLELYVPVLNIAGIFVTLWLLTVVNIKPTAPSIARIQTDTVRTTVATDKYVYGFLLAHKPLRRSAKMVANF